MKAKYFLIACILLAIVTVGAVSASDDISDNLTVEDVDDEPIEVSDDAEISHQSEENAVMAGEDVSGYGTNCNLTVEDTLKQVGASDDDALGYDKNGLQFTIKEKEYIPDFNEPFSVISGQVSYMSSYLSQDIDIYVGDVKKINFTLPDLPGTFTIYSDVLDINDFGEYNISVKYNNDLLESKVLRVYTNLTFRDLNDTLRNGGAEISLAEDYIYRQADGKFIEITQNYSVEVLDGNGHILDGNGGSLYFLINKPNMVFKNIVFRNFTNYIIHMMASNTTFYNCTFENNAVVRNCIIYAGPDVGAEVVDSCTFKNNTVRYIFEIYQGNVTNCIFEDNEVGEDIYRIVEGMNIYIDNGIYDFKKIEVADECIIDNNDYRLFRCEYLGTSQNKNITIIINGTVRYNDRLIRDEDNRFEIYASFLERIIPGQSNITVLLTDDGKDPVLLYNGTIYIDYDIDVFFFYGDRPAFGGHEIKYNSDFSNYEVTLPLNATGNLEIIYQGYYNPDVKYSEDDYGALKAISKLQVNGLSIGNYTFSATLKNDSKYGEKTVTVPFEIVPNVKVPITVLVGADESVIVELPESYRGYVSIWNTTSEGGIPVRDSMFANVSISGGIAKVSMADIASGLKVDSPNYLYVIISGDCEFDKIYTMFYLGENAPGYNSSIASDEIEEGGVATLNVGAADGNCYAYINVDEEFYSALSFFDGLEQVKNISGLSTGMHRIRVVIFDRSTSIPIYVKALDVTVKQKPSPAPTVPAKIVPNDLSAYYNKASYSVTVYGTDGKLASGVLVTFKVNGKKIGTAKTNAKGVATIKLTQVPKTYKITSEALGKSVTKKLTVKQVLTLKKVTVKKSAKKLVLKATLKEGKKALKGKKITFRFNGKKVKTVKTNKKGIAKVTVKKSMLKKLKKGKKVTYKATYIKDTVKRTVKVRK